MEHIKLSLKLEQVFAKYSTKPKFTRDEFEHHPTETIENALCWLNAYGKIRDEDLPMLLEEFNLGPGGLKEILQNDCYRDKILEIIEKY